MSSVRDEILSRVNDPDAKRLLRESHGNAQRTFDVLTYLWLRGIDGLESAAAAATSQLPTTSAATPTFDNTEFTCPACGKRQCTTWEKQTRSLDEAATLFAKCVCGKVWRPPQ